MITAEYLRRILRYDPDTGVFIWLVHSGRAGAGSVAGSPDSHCYLVIQIDGKRYPSHRLAWLYQTGEWPTRMLDHRDCDRANNRWANLRLATKAQNAMNSRRRADNASGFKGVCWHKVTGKWIAQIRVDGRTQHLGLHATAEQAHAAYVAKASELFGEFARVA